MALSHGPEDAELPHHAKQYADSIVKRLFSVGLHLNTALDDQAVDQTDDPDLAYLNQAIEELDAAIQDVQRIALNQVGDTDILLVR